MAEKPLGFQYFMPASVLVLPSRVCPLHACLSCTDLFLRTLLHVPVPDGSSIILLSCNTGDILAILLASLFNLLSSLFPIQILWINIVTGRLSTLVLGIDFVDLYVMKRSALGHRSKSSTEGSLIAASTLFAYLCVL